MLKAFISLLRPSRRRRIWVRCPDLRRDWVSADSIDARHEGIPGFFQPYFSASHILMVGAGGLGGEIAEGLVRKGIGRVIILDGDRVELSNLNRQRFYKGDIGKYKAVALAQNLRREGYMGTLLVGLGYHFEQALQMRII